MFYAGRIVKGLSSHDNVRMNPLTRQLAATVLLAALPAHAQQEEAPKGCKYVNVASVPVRYTGPGLALTMEGSLNNSPATLLVDTGASVTTLTRTGTEPRDMALWNTGRSSVGIGGYSRVYQTRFKEFRAGPASSRPRTLRGLHDFGAAPAFDGLVRAPFPLQADPEFSLAEKQIRFSPPPYCG